MSSHEERPEVPSPELRHRAETLWHSHHEELTTKSPEEASHLVEELQIHQLELQLQNQELREIQSYLEDARRELSDLYDFAPAGYVTVDVNGVIVRANLTLAAMLGEERRHLIGRHVHHYVNRTSRIDHFYRALSTDTPSWSGELELCRLDGTLLPVAVDMARIGGDVALWRCVITDITARKAAEEARRETAALRASEDRYRGLAEQIVDGIFVADAQGRFVDANQAGCELLGYTLVELTTLSMADVLTSEELASLSELLRRLQAAHIVRGEWRFRRKNGSIFSGELAGRQLPDGRLQCVIRDVTDRKEREDVQRRLHALAMMPLDGNLDELFGAIVETAIAIAHADFGNMQLADVDASKLHIVAQRGFPQWWIDYWHNVPEGKGACGSAFRLGDRVIVEDVEQSPIFEGADLAMQRQAGVRAVQSTPLISRSGKFVGMLSTHFSRPHRPDERTLQMLDVLAREAADILGEVHAEAELERQAALLDLAHDAIFVRDRDGRITYWNEGAVQCYGWTRAEVLGQVSNTLLQTQFPQPLEQILETMMRTGHWEGELVHTCRDGRRLTVDSRWTVRRDTIGDDLRVLEINKNITARKAADAALHESEERTRLAMTAARAGLWIWDKRTNEMFWDDRVRELMGVPLSQQPTFEAFLSRVPQAEQPRLLARLEHMMQTPGDDTWQEEFPLIHPDGTTRWISGLGRADRDADGRVVRIIGMDLDISDRKRRELERVDEARRKDEFLAFLGHELRNPLAAVDLATQVLSAGASPQQRVRMEDILRRQTVLMRRLVDDLLELERISHGHVELKLERLDLAECLKRSAAVIQSTVTSRRQELVLRLPSESVSFVADSARVDQIIGNLLTNASKYTKPGGRIELSGARDADAVIIRCTDTGQGILPEDQRKIFEPFTRGRKTNLGFGEASVGLGLALVKQLTELHGGTIAVSSDGADCGSAFTVRLPIVASLLGHAVAEQPNLGLATHRPRSIVIVEDNPSVAAALQAALEQAGHRVQTFADGPSALAGVSELKPDAFVIDIGLPRMDGYELAATLKQMEHTKDALCIAVSGLNRRDRSGQNGDAFDHYFIKPVDVQAILAFVDQH